MTWMKRIGVVLIGVVVLVLVAAASVYALSEKKRAARFTAPAEPALAVTKDSATIARGEHLTRALAKCQDCHGPDLGGTTMIDEPMLGHFETANLTAGKGGLLATYTDGDIERAVRHGIAKDGRSIIFMPSEEFNKLTDDDLAAMVAYIRTQPAVDREHVPIRIGPVFRTLWVAGKLSLTPAAVIKHDEAHAKSAPTGTPEERGKYLARASGCQGCHGETLSGGPIPGSPPEWKPAANLTPAGIGAYSLADFTKIIREGIRPNGTAVDSLMPVKYTKNMTDDEIGAVYAYLKTVPPKATGGR